MQHPMNTKDIRSLNFSTIFIFIETVLKGSQDATVRVVVAT